MVISDDWFLDENSCEIVVAVHKIGHGRMEGDLAKRQTGISGA